MRNLPCIMLFACFFVTSPAFARECDVASILKMNSKVITLTEETSTLWAMQARSNSEKNQSASFGASYLGYSLDKNTSSSIASAIEQAAMASSNSKMDLRSDERYLSAEAVDAYKACLDSQQIMIEVEPSANISNSFFVKITRRVPETGVTESSIKLMIINGFFTDKDQKLSALSADFKGNTSQSFMVVDRNTGKKTEISATATTSGGSTTENITIPAFVRIVPRSIDSEVVTASAGTKRHLCIVTPNANTFLIKESLKWQGIYTDKGARTSKDADNTTQSVCGTAFGAAGGKYYYTGKLSVEAIEIVKGTSD